MHQPHGTFAPNAFARAIISTTERLPNNYFGLRIAMALRRLVIAQLNDDCPFDVLRWGLRIRLYPRANGCEKMALFTPQMYEAPEFLALSKLIDDRRRAHRPFVFFDLGANVGLFSFFVASRTGPEATIFAFEPEPESARRFRFNLASNPGLPIRLSATAIGDGPDDLFLESIIATAEARGLSWHEMKSKAASFAPNASRCWTPSSATTSRPSTQ